MLRFLQRCFYIVPDCNNHWLCKFHIRPSVTARKHPRPPSSLSKYTVIAYSAKRSDVSQTSAQPFMGGERESKHLLDFNQWSLQLCSPCAASCRGQSSEVVKGFQRKYTTWDVDSVFNLDSVSWAELKQSTYTQVIPWKSCIWVQVGTKIAAAVYFKGDNETSGGFNCAMHSLSRHFNNQPWWEAQRDNSNKAYSNNMDPRDWLKKSKLAFLLVLLWTEGWKTEGQMAGCLFFQPFFVTCHGSFENSYETGLLLANILTANWAQIY